MVLGERSPGRVGRRPITNEKRTIRILPVVRFFVFAKDQWGEPTELRNGVQDDMQRSVVQPTPCSAAK